MEDTIGAIVGLIFLGALVLSPIVLAIYALTTFPRRSPRVRTEAEQRADAEATWRGAAHLHNQQQWGPRN